MSAPANEGTGVGSVTAPSGELLRAAGLEQYANAPSYRENPVQSESAPRQVSITPALNGWIVQIGCKTLVFNNLQQLLDEMRNYYTNPKETATRFLSSKTNNV